ncbi:hypothetical protein [Corynebacterium cystitidis]|uniref:hypothetical protein n=1 Tax=Corynebacterium cystitidis TaxID=35757 RepID=UPI00211F2D91|nr:hypothetical protein [Corynebacterium cystitidis]
MKSVTYVGIDGSLWPLTDPSHEGVFLQAVPDVLRSDERGESVSGVLDFVVADHDSNGADLRPIRVTERRWRRAWSVRKFGTLRVEDDEGVDFWLRVRLALPIEGFSEVDPDGYVAFSQSVEADSDVWMTTMTHQGINVTVTNNGDVEAWPRVRWLKSGDLIMPSGAATNLPSVPAARTIILDPKQSCIVLDDESVEDNSVWRALRGKVFPEPIPVDETRSFIIPEGSTLSIDVGVASPW